MHHKSIHLIPSNSPPFSWLIKEQSCSRDPALHLPWAYSKLFLKLCLNLKHTSQCSIPICLILFVLNNWTSCQHSYTQFRVHIFIYVSICSKLNTGSVCWYCNYIPFDSIIYVLQWIKQICQAASRRIHLQVGCAVIFALKRNEAKRKRN